MTHDEILADLEDAQASIAELTDMLADRERVIGELATERDEARATLAASHGLIADLTGLLESQNAEVARLKGIIKVLKLREMEVETK